jgi:hypothetical protein
LVQETAHFSGSICGLPATRISLFAGLRGPDLIASSLFEWRRCLDFRICRLRLLYVGIGAAVANVVPNGQATKNDGLSYWLFFGVGLPDVFQGFGEGLLFHCAVCVAGVAREYELIMIALGG